MSSFIVSEKCMRHIIYNLFWNSDFKERINILQRNGYNSCEDFNRLAIEFYKMNREAVKQRYDENEDVEYIKIPETVNWDNDKLNKYQCLKSMQCLRYQCSEGTIPATKLYQFLDKLIESWMAFIINEIPEYDNAEWD